MQNMELLIERSLSLSKVMLALKKVQREIIARVRHGERRRRAKPSVAHDSIVWLKLRLNLRRKFWIYRSRLVTLSTHRNSDPFPDDYLSNERSIEIIQFATIVGHST